MRILLFISALLMLMQVVVAQEVTLKWYDHQTPLEDRIEALIEAMTLVEKASQLKDVSIAIPRLEIPEYNWWNECLHGVARNGRATVFPQAIGMAATFDTELVQKVASAISDEARAKFNISVKNGNRSRYAGLTFWTPNVNIFRDARWGRGQETYGEDPYLTSQIGVSFVKGLQGDQSKYLKVAACAKHYAVHSGPEALRHEFDAIPPMKDLYETYFPAFKALVQDAKVETVMGAYNRVYGEPACGSYFLLQETLRNDWGFKGHIVSDCGALQDFHLYHKVTNSPAESAALAINNGIDLNCGDTYDYLVEAVNQGLVTETTINERLRSLLRTRFKLGLFDPSEMNPFNAVGEEVICSQKHRDLALEAARKSMVLLVNKNQALPLSPNIRNLYVTGPQANNSEVLLGNYYGMSGNLVNILEGITGAVSAGTTINYKQGCLPYRENVNPIDWTTDEAKSSDVIIAVLGISGMLEGEEGEAIASPYKGDRLEPVLPENQLNFLRKLREDNDKPLIVVMTGGSPMIIPEVVELADAILWAWYPGQEGGTAVADILFGKVSPSGRLPITFPASMDQLPPYEDYSMKGRTYKYMDKEPLFPFGFGLAYTQFAYSDIKIDTKKIDKTDPVQMSVRVRNTGTMDAEEVVQAYVMQPGAGKSAPFQKLVAFKRIALSAGQESTVSFSIDKESFAQYDTEGEASVLPGEYKIVIGGSSPIKNLVERGATQPVQTSFMLK